LLGLSAVNLGGIKGVTQKAYTPGRTQQGWKVERLHGSRDQAKPNRDPDKR